MKLKEVFGVSSFLASSCCVIVFSSGACPARPLELYDVGERRHAEACSVIGVAALDISLWTSCRLSSLSSIRGHVPGACQ